MINVLKKYSHKKEVKLKSCKGKSFEEFNLHPSLIEKRSKITFTMTEVQDKSLAVSNMEKMFFVRLKQGLKTLSFLLPMIHISF